MRGYLYVGDEQILPVQLENAAEVHNEDILVSENGIYTADEGYTGLGTVIVNVSGGGSSTYKAKLVMEGIITSQSVPQEKDLVDEVIPILEDIIMGTPDEDEDEESE